MADYLDVLDSARASQKEHAAAVPVFYEPTSRKRRRGLTKRKKDASLEERKTKARETSSESEDPPMAKGKDKRKKAKKSGRLTKAEIKKAGGIKQAWAARKRKARDRKAGAKKAAKTRKREEREGKRAKKSTKARKARKSSKPRVRRKRKTEVVETKKRHRRSDKKSRKHTTSKARKTTRKARKTHRSAKKVPRGGRRTRRAIGMKLPRESTHKTRSGKKRRSSRKVTVTVRNGKKTRSRTFRAPRKAKKVYAIAAERRRHHRRRRDGAMENPLTGAEIFIGSVTGLAGFVFGDFVDRMLATHALTASGTTTTGTTTSTYTDTPPTSGDYNGLYNATAICAPMDLTRWAAAVGVPAATLAIAHFVEAPNFRAALQFFAFGYGARGIGKGLIDLIASATTTTELGQQLYDGEMRAAILQQNQGNTSAAALANLPSAGLGRPRGQLVERTASPQGVGKIIRKPCGCGKAGCGRCAAKGVGAPRMTRKQVVLAKVKAVLAAARKAKTGTGAPVVRPRGPAPTTATKSRGAGYPSMPVTQMSNSSSTPASTTSTTNTATTPPTSTTPTSAPTSTTPASSAPAGTSNSQTGASGPNGKPTNGGTRSWGGYEL